LNPWLPLGITVVLMPVLAYMMTTFVLVPRLQNSLGLAVSAAMDPGEKKAGLTAKKQSFMMTKLLVNVHGTMGSRYLLVSLSLFGNDPEFKIKVQELEPQLRDLACSTLEAKTISDLEKSGARNLIRSELLGGFNNILGSTIIQEIYITEFAIQ
jgi:flagellar basal body-associated protein FliL